MTKTTSIRSIGCMVALLAISGLPARAQTLGPTDPSGGSGQSAQVRNEAPLGGGSCRNLVASSRLVRKVSFSQGDGDVDVFDPGAARDMQATIANRSTSAVRMEVLREGSRAPAFETIPAGATVIREYTRVLDVVLRCEDPTGAPCRVELDLRHGPPSASDVAPDLPLWYPGPVAQGDADLPPDSDIDCLWEEDLIWSSAVGRKIELLVEVTGDHDLRVEVEDANNTFGVHDLRAPPAFPNALSLHLIEENIIAVRIMCNKSPVNACSNCKYHYSLTVLP
ncbi:MAG: hypothetical protein Q9Q40_00300 [Acidobacteriota bacterium]|nr:hypothetical protein [Acidobacteriota bacterium]MDQ7087402.1 hypothetical protein [Acidobacteriota bacterium]